MNPYWLGLLTIPTAAGCLVLFVGLVWLVDKGLSTIVHTIKLGSAEHRAAVAAVVSCSRRARIVKLPGNCVLAFAAGLDEARADAVRTAVREALIAAPKVRTSQAEGKTDGG